MRDDTDPVARPDAWAELSDAAGWLILMEPGGTVPRVVVSDQDEYFIKASVRAAFPGKKVRTVMNGKTRAKHVLREA